MGRAAFRRWSQDGSQAAYSTHSSFRSGLAVPLPRHVEGSAGCAVAEESQGRSGGRGLVLGAAGAGQDSLPRGSLLPPRGSRAPHRRGAGRPGVGPGHEGGGCAHRAGGKPGLRHEGSCARGSVSPSGASDAEGGPERDPLRAPQRAQTRLRTEKPRVPRPGVLSPVVRRLAKAQHRILESGRRSPACCQGADLDASHGLAAARADRPRGRTRQTRLGGVLARTAAARADHTRASRSDAQVARADSTRFTGAR